jgi:hypothetical protein
LKSLPANYERHVGKTCLIIAAASALIQPVLLVPIWDSYRPYRPYRPTLAGRINSITDPMKQLDRISNFGAIDADNDDLLLSSFEDHQAFEALMRFERFLVIGKKGSGKTAIYKKLLTTKEPDFFSWGHTFADYPWHHHTLQARVGIPDYDKFTHSWKYLILLTAAKVILNHDNSLPFDEKSFDEMARIEKFVIDSYGTRDPDVTQIFSKRHAKRLAVIS